MYWWDATDGVVRGRITLAEAGEFLLLDVAEMKAERVRAARARAEFHRHRGTIEVPASPEPLDVLQALADAIDHHADVVRGYRWYREYLERGEDAEAHAAPYLGYATFDEVAAALMGVSGEGWKLRKERRVVPVLRRLLADGLVCRGDRGDGNPYGYELTPDGAAALELDEVAA